MRRRLHVEVVKTSTLIARVFLFCTIGLAIVLVVVGSFLGWSSLDIGFLIVGLVVLGFLFGGMGIGVIESVLLSRARKKTRLDEGEHVIREFDGGHETLRDFSRGKWFITNQKLIYEGRTKYTDKINDFSFHLSQLETLDVQYKGPDDLLWRATDWLVKDKTKIAYVLTTFKEDKDIRTTTIYIKWPDLHLVDFLRTIQVMCTNAGKSIKINFET